LAQLPLPLVQFAHLLCQAFSLSKLAAKNSFDLLSGQHTDPVTNGAKFLSDLRIVR